MSGDDFNFGARPGKHGGADFKVWAPHATALSVVGDFNQWSEERDMLEREGDFWEGHVENAKPGSEYKFVVETSDGRLYKNDPAAYELTNSAGNSILIDHSAFDWGDDQEFVMPAWNELVVYEMHLGTYHRGDNEETVGTFGDAIERLDHLLGLGINCIELMPVAEFAGDQSWGYNPAFPFAIESDYGGVQGLKQFVKTCHSKGVAVIMDVVYNHFGPSDLDMWRFDGWSENDLGGIFFYNDWRAKTPWGDTRPDYGRQEVRQYIRDNALMWLRDYHVDGLRFDMTFYMRSVDDAAEIPEGWSLAQWINHDIAQEFPGALTIAEDLRSNEWITKDSGAGGAGFGSQWDEQFVHPIREVLACQDDDQRDLQRVIEALTFRYNADAFQRVVYTESHDEVANGKARLPTEVDEHDDKGYWARKRSLLGGCLTMTAPGIPMIFQGQELLVTGSFEDHSELDWRSGSHNEGVVRLYRDLIRLRRNSDGWTRGLTTQEIEILHANSSNRVLVFTRGNDDSGKVVVVLNLTNRSWSHYRIPLPDGGHWSLRFRADSEFYGPDFGAETGSGVSAEDFPLDGRQHSAAVSLGGYDCLIYSHGN